MKEKSLPFFIGLLNKIDRDKRYNWIVYDDLQRGIASNPNLTREQFQDILKMDSYSKDQLFYDYIHNHPNREDQIWIWELSKKQGLYELSTWYTGKYLLDSNNKNENLHKSIMDHFKSLKEPRYILNDKGEKVPISIYGFFLEYMLEIESDMHKFDEYVRLYNEYKFQDYRWPDIKKDEVYKECLKIITANRYLDEERILKLYNESNNIHEESRVNILSNLLNCSNISEKSFEKILGYEKEIKARKRVSILYEGAVKNETHISQHFNKFYTYLKQGLKHGNPRWKVFRNLMSNPALSEEQISKLMEILENVDPNIGAGVFRQLHDIVITFFERDKISKEQMDRVLNIYLDSFNIQGKRADEIFVKKHAYYYDWGTIAPSGMPEATSRLHLDDDLFHTITKKVLKNRLRYYILLSLLSNRSLSKSQFDLLIKSLDPVYFDGNNFMEVNTPPSQDSRMPNVALRNWASCKYITN